MITSLMQKHDDSRTSFELVKQQLKQHIVHQKNLQRCENVTQGNCDTSSASSFLSAGVEGTLNMPKSDNDHAGKNLTRSETAEVPLSNTVVSKTWLQQDNNLTSFDLKYNKNKNSIMTEEDILPEGHKILPAVSQNFLHLYINDLLTSNEFSIQAYHLLNCLCILGPIPIPLFLIEELDKIITKAENNGLHGSVTPLIQQLEVGVLRKYPLIFLYHKDFNPKFLDPAAKLMYIPKLLCDVIRNSMYDADIALSITCVQEAVRNVLMNQLTINQLHFVLLIVNQLDDPCSNLHKKFNEENIKLKMQVTYLVSLHKKL